MTTTQLLENIATNARDIGVALDSNRPVDIIYEDIREMAAAILLEANEILEKGGPKEKEGDPPSPLTDSNR